jgi:hypothetical protein
MTTTTITGFHQDDELHWVAELACGHSQHVRHQPPWQNRPWTQTAEGRAGQLGMTIDCSLCQEAESSGRGSEAAGAVEGRDRKR